MTRVVPRRAPASRADESASPRRGVLRRLARLWSGANQLSVELALPLGRRGWSGWVLVPHLGQPAALDALLPALHAAGLATLSLNLLASDLDPSAAFDAPRLGARLTAAARWLLSQPEARGQRLGLLAAGPAAGAALWAAADLGPQAAAVVSLAGRADLAAKRLPAISAPTLLIASRADRLTLDLNRQAAQRLNARSRLVLAPSFFYQRQRLRDPGVLDTLLAVEWLGQHVAGLNPAALPRPPITPLLPPAFRRGGAVAAATVAAVVAALAGPAQPAEAAGSLDVTGGALTYTGSGSSTSLIVGLQDGTYVFLDPGEGSISLSANATAAGCINVVFPYWAACPDTAVNTLSINTGAGNDDVSLVLRDGFDHTTVDGGSNSDDLSIDDTNTNFNDTNTLTGSTFTRSFIDTITYQNFETLAITAEPGGNTINIQGTSIPTTFDGHDGSDTFIIGSGNSLDAIDGALGIVGGAGTNALRVLDSASGNAMTFNGLTVTRTGMAGITIGSGINSVSLDSGSGNDSLLPSFFVNGPVTLRGGDGNDTISGGPGNTNDLLDGGPGSADRLVASGDALWDLDNTQITSFNHGFDLLVGGTFEQASLIGTSGTDIVWADQFTQGPVTIVGGDGDDLLTGTPLSDNISGGNGDDTLRGLAGNDTLNGGADIDLVREDFVGTGNLTLSNTSLATEFIGTDNLSSINEAHLVGSGGADTLNASAFTNGPVTLVGGGGNDTLIGGGANINDSLDGGSGSDWVFGTADTDWTLTNSQLATNNGQERGDDTLSSIEHASLTGGGSGNHLNAGSFTLGSVVLNGAGNNDELDGGSGDDTLTGGSGNDNIDGNGGTDVLLETGNGDFDLDNNALTGVMGSDNLSDIERASLTGGAGNNTLNASDFMFGPVTLDGAGGDDTLHGGFAGDSLVGGSGSDLVQINRAAFFTPQVLIVSDTLLAATGQLPDTLSGIDRAHLLGGVSDDTLDASAFTNGAVTLFGNLGNDVLRPAGFSDFVDGSVGTDTLEVAANTDMTLIGNTTEATLTGVSGVGTDTVGGIEVARLSGGAGGNVINASGFSGKVSLFGLGGDDILSGGLGDDFLDGGSHATGDAVVLNAGDASITLSGSGFSGQGNDTVVNVEAYGVIGGPAGQTFDASGFSFSVLLNGMGGNDTIIGSGQSDTIIGGAGDDILTGGAAADQIYGDETAPGVTGTDRLVETTDNNMTLSNTSLAIGVNTDTLTSIEEASLTGGGSSNALNAGAFTNGVATLVGQGGDDTLTAAPNAGSLEGGLGGVDLAIITRDGNFTIADTGATGTTTFSFNDIENVSLTGGAGDNSLNAGGFTRGSVTLRGQGGNDTLTGTIFADSLDGGTGTGDRLTYTGDNDYLVLSNSSLANLNSGITDAITGFEQASLKGGAGTSVHDARLFSGAVTLDGQAGTDYLYASNAGATLLGGDGDDWLGGGLGADIIDGGTGANDTVYAAGDVNFVLSDDSLAGQGGDQLIGIEKAYLTGVGTSANSLNASAFTLGPVTLLGMGGNDTLTGGAGNDSLDGGADFDTASINIGNGDITLTGSSIEGNGTDTMVSIEAFLVQGGPGPNKMDASAFIGAVTMLGGGGNDTLIGGSLGDSLLGEAGNDLITGNGGNDTIDGGLNTDRVTAEGDIATFTLTDSALTGDGSDVLSNIEEGQLTGGSTANAFNAQAFSGLSYLDGGAGDDTFTISPNGGVITGGLGANDAISLTANANFTLSDTELNATNQYQISGIEAASLTGGASGNNISAALFSGRTTIHGLGGNDTVAGGVGPDELYGDGGDDTVTGNQGADSIDGGAGTADKWLELADFNITLIAEGILGEQIDTVTAVELASITGKDSFDNRFNLSGFAGTATIDGAAGNDILTGGDVGDVVLGSAGNDTITGEAANDTLDGGDGTDRLVATGALTLTLSTVRLEGVGRDTLANIEEAFLTGSSENNLYDASAFGSLDTAVGQVTMLGLDGNDTLIGGVKADSLSGGQGNDSLLGGDGDDTLTGGDTTPGANTNDTLFGGPGNDLLDGVFGNDSLFGEGGNDQLIGAAGHDTMDGGSGDDTLSAAFDDDTAVGTPGDDVLTGGVGNDSLEGGVGTDLVVETGDVDFAYEAGDPGTGTLHGGALGDDTLVLVERASLTGGSSANMFDLAAFPGPVTLVGANGPDTFTGSAFDDQIFGGQGADRVKEASDTNWTLTDTSLSGRGSDTLGNIEESSLTGGAGPNLIDASAFSGNTTLDGAAGSDTLVGGGGHDSVLGGDDDDTLTGNLGDDSLIGGLGSNGVTELITATTGVTLTLTNESLLGLGTDVLSNTFKVTLTGGAGPDLFLASAFTGTATLNGAGANDTLTGGQGNDSLDGGPGADRLTETYDRNLGLTDSAFTVSTTVELLSTDILNSIEQASLTGGASANRIDAGTFTGVTTLAGLGSNDALIGGTNNDSVSGGAGLDTLTGGLGNDTLDGGADTDRLAEAADVPLLKLTNGLLTGLGTDQLISLEQASLAGGPGDNTLDASAYTGPVTLTGQAGNDSLLGGSGSDSLDGGEGNDTLSGGGGSDILFGGAGAFEDAMVETSNANPIILTSANLIAGPTDFLNSIEVASLTGGAANQIIDASGFTGRVRIDGGGGNDSLTGTVNVDTLLGGSGDDTIQGRAGSDQLDGGAGELDRLLETADANLSLTNATLVITQGVTLVSTDVLTGFEQASLTGGLGPNLIETPLFTGTVTLVGGNNHDRLIAGPNHDSLVGGAGNDSLTGGGGDDTLLGGSEVDRVVETGDVNFVLLPDQLTGLGTDTLDSLEEADLTGGPSANTLDTTQFAGPVTLSGADGGDLLLSGIGADCLFGGGGDDTMPWGGGNDTVSGGADTDRLTVTADSDYVLTDAALTGPANLTLDSLEQASLTGGASDNDFDLLDWSGSATIEALAGQDALTVGGTGGPDSYTVSGTEVTYDSVTIAFNDLETLSLYGGEGDDDFTVLTLPLAQADGGGGESFALTAINLFGGNGDDYFNVAPFPDVTLHIEGGNHAAGDTLDFRARGLYVAPDTGGILQAEGQQPVTYTGIEFVNIFDRLYRLFLSLIGK